MSSVKLEAAVGRILISEPFLSDPNFARSVVLLTEHNDQGTMGFVLNHVVELSLADVVQAEDLPDIALIKGGPVELNTLHFIHTIGEVIPNAIQVKTGLWWGGDFEKIVDVISDDPKRLSECKFFIGYSGWAPGQLKDELENDAWVVSSISSKEAVSPILESTVLWKNAMRRMGGEFEILSNSPLDPQWN